MLDVHIFSHMVCRLSLAGAYADPLPQSLQLDASVFETLALMMRWKQCAVKARELHPYCQRLLEHGAIPYLEGPHTTRAATSSYLHLPPSLVSSL